MVTSRVNTLLLLASCISITLFRACDATDDTVEALGYRHTNYYSPGSLIWYDEFDGIDLDPYYWTHDVGDGGWGNFEKQTYTYNSVQVANGNLKIIARQLNNGEYNSGRINTQGGLAFKYGRLEARIRMPSLQRGLWPAFWLMGINYGPNPWPTPGEIDIVEMGKGDWGDMINHRVMSAAHWEHEGDYSIHDKFRESIFELTEVWNTYTLDWTEDYIRTYIGDELIWEMDLDSDVCTDCEEFHDFHFILLNMAVGGRFTYVNGEEASITAPLPAVMKVDYVRLYANENTEVLMRSVPQAQAVVAEPSATPSMEPSSAPSLLEEIIEPGCSGKSCRGKGKGKGGGPKKKRDGSSNGANGSQSLNSQLRSSSMPKADYSYTFYVVSISLTTILAMACTIYF